MEIWCWSYWWNAPRRIDDPEFDVAMYAEENSDHFLFFAELVAA